MRRSSGSVDVMGSVIDWVVLGALRASSLDGQAQRVGFDDDAGALVRGCGGSDPSLRPPRHFLS